MSNVLDRIIQKSDTEPKEFFKGTKAYSNMLVNLKELKLHNEKNLELTEQIFDLSEKNIEKVNELQELISNNLKTENGSDKELLQKIQITLSDLQKSFDELKNKNTQDHDNDVRVLKREMAVLNSSLEENMSNHLSALEETMTKTKRTLLLYMRVIIWMLFGIIFLLLIRFLPIF